MIPRDEIFRTWKIHFGSGVGERPWLMLLVCVECTDGLHIWTHPLSSIAAESVVNIIITVCFME